MTPTRIANCFQCQEPITDRNPGIMLCDGIWQCDDCHHIEWGVWPWHSTPLSQDCVSVNEKFTFPRAE
jgi:ribosomal protein L37AE/L43A